MYLFNGNVILHGGKQQVSVEHMKLRRGAASQGFCAENTALVLLLTLPDSDVLEPRGRCAARRIMLLIFVSCGASPWVDL